MPKALPNRSSCATTLRTRKEKPVGGFCVAVNVFSEACSGYNKPQRSGQSDPAAGWLPGIEPHHVRAHLLLDFASLDQFIWDEPNLGALRIVVDLQFVPYHVGQQGFARNSSRPRERKAAGINFARDFVGKAKRRERSVAALGDRLKRGGFDGCLSLRPLACLVNFALLSPPPQGKNAGNAESKSEYSGEYRDACRVHPPSITVKLSAGNGHCWQSELPRRSPE
jgi:hypothetical protein